MLDPVPHDAEEEERRRRREEEMEHMLMEQEAAQEEDEGEDHEHNRNLDHDAHADVGENLAHLHEDDRFTVLQPTNQPSRKFRLSYSSASLGAAVGMLWYALRTRRQWYLALVFLGSSKYAYIILGNALISLCISLFRFLTTHFLGGLRLVEHEGLGDFFRWNITETCLALTMFRADLSVENAILFLFLILNKCLHWVVEMRESHLRMTQDAIVPVSSGLFKGFPTICSQQLGLQTLINILLVADVIGLVCCIQNVATYGASVMLLFGFECAILLVSCMSLTLLWNLHVVDGLLHYWHDTYGHSQWLHAWKDRKATLIFALEVQAQGAKFIFYCAFFAIIMTNNGLPINLFRGVYVSFQTLRLRLAAFQKYRQLVQSMNRFPTPPDDHEDMSCIICRDTMSIHDSKQLPGCGHVFHTCCLREWLVQQQTCPTCRGDIRVTTTTTARPRVVPVVQEQEQQQQPAEAQLPQPVIEEPVAAATDNDNVDVGQDRRHDSAWDEGRPHGQNHGTTKRQHASVRVDSSAQSIVSPPLDEPALPRHEEQEKQQNQKQQHVHSQANAATADRSSIFPALYRVVAPQAIVYVDQSGTVARRILGGTIVLCLEMELQTLLPQQQRELNNDDGNDQGDDDFRLMMRIAGGGWIRENQVEFVTSVPVSDSN